MRHLKSGLILAGVAALSLSACSKKAEETIKTETAAAPAAGQAAAPADGPRHKAGLWQQTAFVDGVQLSSAKICIDDAYSASMPIGGAPAGAQCAKRTVTRSPGGYAISTQCDMGTGGQLTVEGTVTGDYDTAYELAVTSTTTGAQVAHMNRATKLNVSSKRLGDCPAGMKGGEIEVAGGVTVDRSGYDPAKAKAIAEAAKKAGQ